MTEPSLTEPLALLGDRIRQAQEITGISPVPPKTPVYEQSYGPRNEEAARRLAALGYRVHPGLFARLRKTEDDASVFKEALVEFRSDAGLPPEGGLDRAAWELLDKLRGLGEDIDPARFRGPGGEWLPAMRRAIATRIEELALPDIFVSWHVRDAPAPETTTKLLSGFDYVLPGSLNLTGQAKEDALVPILLSHEKLRQAAKMGILSSAPAQKLSGLDEALRKLERKTLGIGDLWRDLPEPGDGPGRGLMSALLERPRDTSSLSTAEAQPLWTEIERFVYETPAIAEHWDTFVKRPENVWQGTLRILSLLRTARDYFRESGKTLGQGLSSVAKGSEERIAIAVRAGVFKFVYEGFCEAFEAVHLAAARFVAHIEERPSGPIALRKGSSRTTLMIDERASRSEIEAFLKKRAREDESLLLSAEILGIMLRLTASWATGPFGSGVVIVTMVGSIPRLIALGRELERYETMP